jgi:hypothetical protein
MRTFAGPTRIEALCNRSLHISPTIRVERRMVTSQTRNCVSPFERHRFILDITCVNIQYLLYFGRNALMLG